MTSIAETRLPSSPWNQKVLTLMLLVSQIERGTQTAVDEKAAQTELHDVVNNYVVEIIRWPRGQRRT